MCIHSAYHMSDNLVEKGWKINNICNVCMFYIVAQFFLKELISFHIDQAPSHRRNEYIILSLQLVFKYEVTEFFCHAECC